MALTTRTNSNRTIDNRFMMPMVEVDELGMFVMGAGWFQTSVAGSAILAASVSGFLGSVVLNTFGSASNRLYMWDSSVPSAGTLIGIVDTSVAVQRDYNIRFLNGLSVIMGTLGTPADLTIIGRIPPT